MFGELYKEKAMSKNKIICLYLLYKIYLHQNIIHFIENINYFII